MNKLLRILFAKRFWTWYDELADASPELRFTVFFSIALFSIVLVPVVYTRFGYPPILPGDTTLPGLIFMSLVAFHRMAAALIQRPVNKESQNG